MKIYVLVEQRSGVIKDSSLQAISQAAVLASAVSATCVTALVVGSEISNIEKARSYGAEAVIHLKNDNLAFYSGSGYKEVILSSIDTNDSCIIIAANTSFGKDLAAKLAVKLNAGIVTDVVAINSDGGKLEFTKPIYAGKAYQTLSLNSTNKVITLRPNIFPAVVSQNLSTLEVKEVGTPSLSAKVIEYKKNEGKLDVAEASIIVSGGRGMQSPEHFKLIEELADTLGAAVGASRAVVDAGWRPHAEQVGQTGKTVSPTLYVACGISGAIQHLAGMSSSRYIVAINKDKDAPIFSVADYGIAGDVFEVVPALIKALKQ